jgi:hypothetical protein
MAPERYERTTTPGVNVELIGRKAVRLTYPDGFEEILSVPERAPESISDIELIALTTMKLVIPEEFPEETTRTDQAGFRVESEDDIHDLPGGREGDHGAVLMWSGSVLQAKGWPAEDVAQIIFYELPSNPAVGEHLGTISKNVINYNKGRLRRAVAENYPGAAASIKRRRDKGVPDW